MEKYLRVKNEEQLQAAFDDACITRILPGGTIVLEAPIALKKDLLIDVPVQFQTNEFPIKTNGNMLEVSPKGQSESAHIEVTFI